MSKNTKTKTSQLTTDSTDLKETPMNTQTTSPSTSTDFADFVVSAPQAVAHVPAENQWRNAAIDELLAKATVRWETNGAAERLVVYPDSSRTNWSDYPTGGLFVKTGWVSKNSPDNEYSSQGAFDALEKLAAGAVSGTPDCIIVAPDEKAANQFATGIFAYITRDYKGDYELSNGILVDITNPKLGVGEYAQVEALAGGFRQSKVYSPNYRNAKGRLSTQSWWKLYTLSALLAGVPVCISVAPWAAERERAVALYNALYLEDGAVRQQFVKSLAHNRNQVAKLQKVVNAGAKAIIKDLEAGNTVVVSNPVVGLPMTDGQTLDPETLKIGDTVLLALDNSGALNPVTIKWASGTPQGANQRAQLAVLLNRTGGKVAAVKTATAAY